MYSHRITSDAAVLLTAGKMRCLQLLLNKMLAGDSDDKVVVVSNSTAALDLVQLLCDQHSYSTVRIDGGTDVNKRQDIINSFNTFSSARVSLQALATASSCHQGFAMRLSVRSIQACSSSKHASRWLLDTVILNSVKML